MDDLLDTADRLFTGELAIEEHHPFRLFGELAELGEGTMKVEMLACPRCRRLELRLPEQG